MEIKTKKMVMIERKIAEIAKTNGELSERINRIDAFKPKTEQGKNAVVQAVKQTIQQRDENNAALESLRADLEVATVEFLSGQDADLHEPTPADALRNVS